MPKLWHWLKPLAGDASIYVGANIASAVVPFLLLPVLTRVLSPADYGIIAMFGIAISIFGAFTGFSVHGAIAVRFFRLEPAHMAAYVGSCLRILVISSLGVGAIVFALGPVLEAHSQVPKLWLLVAVAVAAAQMASNIRLSLWQVRRKAQLYAAFQLSLATCGAVLSLVLIFGLGMDWEGRVLGQTLTVLGFAVIALIALRGEVAPPKGSEDTRDALRFGVPLVPHVLGGLLVAATDRVMIANLLDVAEAGVYAVALQIGMVIALLTEAFNKAYAPWLMATLSKADASDEARIVRGTYLYFLVIIAIALCVGLAAPVVLSVLVGDQFQRAAPIVLYIALGFAFGGMYYMVTGFVFFASRTMHLAVITFAAGIFNVLITWVLIRANGVVGAAQGFMLSQAMTFIGTWWLAQRARPMPWRKAISSASSQSLR